MEEKESSGMTQKAIALFLTLVSCFGILIPVAGFAYYLGYLGAFGLDTDMFPISLWDLWKNSVYAAIELVLIVPKYLTILLMLILGLLTGFIYSMMLNSLSVSLDEMGLIPKLLKKKIKPSPGKVDRISRWFYNSSKFPLIVFFSAILLLAGFFAFAGLAFLGEINGKKNITGYQASGCNSKKWPSCVDYANPNDSHAKVYSGLLVAASSTHIAIFDGNSISVIPRTPEYVLNRQLRIEPDKE